MKLIDYECERCGVRVEGDDDGVERPCPECGDVMARRPWPTHKVHYKWNDRGGDNAKSNR